MRRVLLLSAVVVFMAAPAFSQSFMPTFELGASGGINFPTGTISDGMKNGFGLNANAGYRAIEMLVVGAEFGYYGNGAKDDLLAASGIGGIDTRILQFTGMAKLMMPVMQAHNIYGKGVAGLYNVKQTFEDMPLFGSGDVSDTKFGAGIGAGLRVNGVSKASFYIEGMFHNVFGDTEDLRFFATTAGVLVALP